MPEASALKIGRASVYAYRLPLIRPMHMLGRQMTHRSGCLLQLQDQRGFCGWGEVAPFAGLHPESLAEAQAQLLSICRDLPGQSFHNSDLLSGQVTDTFHAVASVRWGLGMALLNLLAAREQQLPASLLSPQPLPQIQVNALLSGSDSEILTEAEALLDSGYRAFKLKVGRKSLASEIRLVKNLRTCLGDQPLLRLDANQAWNLAQALEFGKGIAGCAIDYLEEPCAGRADQARFAFKTGIGVALDESLPHLNLHQLDWSESGIQALILRPALTGSWQSLLQLRAQPFAQGIRLVLCNAFESGITLAMMAQLAAILPPEAMGLDTYRWLQADLLKQRIPIDAGQLNLWQVSQYAQSVDHAWLQPLS